MTNIANNLLSRIIRNRQRTLMLELDDHLLTDIGLTRADLHRARWARRDAASQR